MADEEKTVQMTQFQHRSARGTTISFSGVQGEFRIDDEGIVELPPDALAEARKYTAILTELGEGGTAPVGADRKPVDPEPAKVRSEMKAKLVETLSGMKMPELIEGAKKLDLGKRSPLPAKKADLVDVVAETMIQQGKAIEEILPKSE